MRDFAERSARERRKPRKSAVDQKFRPTSPHQVRFDAHRPHHFKQTFRFRKTVSRTVCPQRKGQRIRVGSQLAYARPNIRCPPSDGTAERTVRPDDLRDFRFGQTVLTCADRTVLRKMRQKRLYDLRIAALFCHEHDHVVLPAHLLGSKRAHLLHERREPRNLRTMFAHRRNVLRIPRKKIDRPARARYVRAQNRAHRACPVNCIPHGFLPSFFEHYISRAQNCKGIASAYKKSHERGSRFLTKHVFAENLLFLPYLLILSVKPPAPHQKITRYVIF